jgi:transglutaminase-like putative cysteine protease
MQRYKILHRTYYNFAGLVQLQPHELRLRPKEGHEVHIESSSLEIQPPARLRWHRDVEDNSVAIATFDTPTDRLSIESETVIQQYNQGPLDFLVADYAVHFPFQYDVEDSVLLAPYLDPVTPVTDALNDWIRAVWQPGQAMETYVLLQRLTALIPQRLAYRSREEEGVQSAQETLTLGAGSCRDFANLFMTIARHLGLAARFVSGYLEAQPSTTDYGATHAWVEVFIPGAGWKAFDPTVGEIVGSDHIAVAVARLPESVPPVAGSFIGPPGAILDVGVWVSRL